MYTNVSQAIGTRLNKAFDDAVAQIRSQILTDASKLTARTSAPLNIVTGSFQGEQQPVVPPQPAAAQQEEQQSMTPLQLVAPPPSVPQRLEQPAVTPVAFAPQPVPQQGERQQVAPRPQSKHAVALDVVQLQSHYNASRLFLRPDLGAERLSMIYAGVNLKVIENRGAWLYIESPPPDNRRGWILREWLQE